MAFEADKHLAAEGTTGPVELSAALTAAEELRKGGFLLKKRAGFPSGGGWRPSAALPSRVVQSGRLRGRPARPETLPWQLARGRRKRKKRRRRKSRRPSPPAFPRTPAKGGGSCEAAPLPPRRGCSRDPLLASGPCLRKEPPNCASSPGRRRHPASGSPALAGSPTGRLSESGVGEKMAASAPPPLPLSRRGPGGRWRPEGLAWGGEGSVASEKGELSPPSAPVP